MVNLPSSPKTAVLSSSASTPPSDLTTQTIISHIIETIQVILEQIWYYRSVYPKESFQKQRSFQLQVYSNFHPGVKQYLKETSEQILDLLKRGKLKRLFIDLYFDDKKFESYAFSFTNSILFDYIRQKCPIQFEETFKEGLLYASLQSLLFSVIGRLSRMPELKESPEFKILVSADEDTFNDMIKDQNWILEKTDLSDTHTHIRDVDVKEFKEVNLGYLNIKGYVGRRG
ncbi:DEKNAAC101722 [Brettanomyces naardenensis]|uniref:DEKNAAC101722 n=1 Tax=Brettanomyces naardenensis TaxID=13370 RepID=A0A448YIV3_BRENA|nr:DEKNAAC101722 [Brettanomyces naardenensis]